MSFVVENALEAANGRGSRLRTRPDNRPEEGEGVLGAGWETGARKGGGVDLDLDLDSDEARGRVWLETPGDGDVAATDHSTGVLTDLSTDGSTDSIGSSSIVDMYVDVDVDVDVDMDDRGHMGVATSTTKIAS